MITHSTLSIKKVEINSYSTDRLECVCYAPYIHSNAWSWLYFKIVRRVEDRI